MPLISRVELEVEVQEVLSGYLRGGRDEPEPTYMSLPGNSVPLASSMIARTSKPPRTWQDQLGRGR